MTRAFSPRPLLSIALLLAAWSGVARADVPDPTPSPATGAPPPPASSAPASAAGTNASATSRGGPGVWRSFRAGSKLVHSVPTAALIDGIWSLSAHVNTELTNRSWDAPYPDGTIGQYSTRILYGTSWSLMLGFESLAVLLAAKEQFGWLAEATYRVDYLVMGDAPVCPRTGAWGGCGMGVGDFAWLQVRPRGSRFWFEAGGGWFQQRIANDALRTVAESAWVLSPITALMENSTDLEKPVAIRTFVGPGLFFGMHNGHLHPTSRGAEIYRPPWHEMYLLDGGIGPGARAEARVIFGQHVSLESDVVIAPFLVGGPAATTRADVAPLDFEREGVSVWRRATLGIGWHDPQLMPFKLSASAYVAELSDRPIDKFGYRGIMLRFDIPLRVPTGD